MSRRGIAQMSREKSCYICAHPSPNLEFESSSQTWGMIGGALTFPLGSAAASLHQVGSSSSKRPVRLPLCVAKALLRTMAKAVVDELERRQGSNSSIILVLMLVAMLSDQMPST